MDLQSHLKQRKRKDPPQRFEPYRRTTGEVDRRVLNEGLQTLDDALGTLTATSFKRHPSAELYDLNKFKYKRDVDSTKNAYYVLYPPKMQEKNRLKQGDIIQMFTGTESFTVRVASVHEDLRRHRSAYITTS